MPYPRENTYFEVSVENVNAFSIHFTHRQEVYNRPYPYFISDAKIHPVAQNKLLTSVSFGRNLQPIRTPSLDQIDLYGFGISNIENDRIDLNAPKPLFKLSMDIHVPFFRKGHFIHLNAGWSQRTNPGATFTMKFSLSDSSPVIYEKYSLRLAEVISLPVSWPDLPGDDWG